MISSRSLIFQKLRALYSVSSNKNLIYVGPVNQMVKRMKTFSIGSSLTSTALAPALIYFSADHWSLFAKFGLVSTGKTGRIDWYQHNNMSYLSFFRFIDFVWYKLSVSFANQKVRLYNLQRNPIRIIWSFDHLLIEKLSFWGARKVDSVPLDDLVNGGSIFNTWKSLKTGQGYLIQYIEDQNNNQNVNSYKGEKVDLETMGKIYNEISRRR